MTSLAKIAAVALGCSLFATSHAVVTISTTGNKVDQLVNQVSQTKHKAMGFKTDGSDWTINSVRIFAGSNGDPVFDVRLSIHADAGGAPGAMLAENSKLFFSPNDQVFNFAGVGVSANTDYWIVLRQVSFEPDNFNVRWLTPTGGNPTGLWSHNASILSNDSGATWSASSVPFDYTVDATVVPEPGTMLALGAGLAAVAARRRRKA